MMPSGKSRIGILRNTSLGSAVGSEHTNVELSEDRTTVTVQKEQAVPTVEKEHSDSDSAEGGAAAGASSHNKDSDAPAAVGGIFFQNEPEGVLVKEVAKNAEEQAGATNSSSDKETKDKGALTSVKIGDLPADLSRYRPKLHGTSEFDFSHLRLGVTPRGMIGFLSHKDVGLIVPKDGSDEEGNDPLLGWKYNAEPGLYTRPAAEAEVWLDEAAGGPVEKGGEWGLTNLVGYDICFFIRNWLKREGLEQNSVCEVVLLDDRFRALRDHVGPADVFWSHVQGEDFLGHRLSVEKHISRIDPRTGKYGVRWVILNSKNLVLLLLK
jgi:hypothetical protein